LDDARLAAPHRLSFIMLGRKPASVAAGEASVKRQKRKVVMAIVPARNRESRAQRPYVVFSCRNRQAASGLE